MNSPSVAKLRVLFVDDEGPIRDVMKLELPRMGHDATICEDGESALKALEKNTFDAAIIDLRMPGLSGWDVVDHIKQVSPETEIIISTGHVWGQARRCHRHRRVFPHESHSSALRHG